MARAKHTTKLLLRGAACRPRTSSSITSGPRLQAPFPVIVKPARQDASVGLDQESVCTDQFQLEQRASYIYRRTAPRSSSRNTCPGREFNVALLELPVLQALPPAEIIFPSSGPATGRS